MAANVVDMCALQTQVWCGHILAVKDERCEANAKMEARMRGEWTSLVWL